MISKAMTVLIRLFQFMIQVFSVATARNLDLIAAGVAFYAMLAIFPAAAAIIALWGFVQDPAIVSEQVDLLGTFMPPEAFALLRGQVDVLIAANSSTLGWATILSTAAALWSTRAGVGALVRGLNAIYGTKPRQGFWHSFSAITLTLILIGLALVVLVAVIVVPIVLVFLPLGPMTQVALVAARWALLIVAGLAALWLLYRFGPNHDDRTTRFVSFGAIFALVLWAAASWGFSTYLTNFGSYNQIYGTLGAVIVLLMWFFITAYAVLLGAALNAMLCAPEDGPT